jgi:hypothetical protein
VSSTTFLSSIVIPAQAGTQTYWMGGRAKKDWVPACAGMTMTFKVVSHAR